MVGPNVRLDDGVAAGVFHSVSGGQGEGGEKEGEGGHGKESEHEELGKSRRRRLDLRVGYHVGLYHDMKNTNEDAATAAAADAADGFQSVVLPFTGFVPDLAIAFNAGMWGYTPEEWRPTVERILYGDGGAGCAGAGCPLVVTGYTLEEAENDEDALRDMLGVTGGSGDDADEGEGGGRGGDGDGKGEGRSGDRAGRRGVEWMWESESNPFRSLRERRLEFPDSAYLDGETEGHSSFMGENCGWQCVRAIP